MELAHFLEDGDMSMATFGRKVGVVRQYVHKIATGIQRPSPSLAMKIERATGGSVSKEELRPDIWPPEFAPAPAVALAPVQSGSPSGKDLPAAMSRRAIS
jgi:DNA-binding transcriptional regulator YdaS (Cro superfamily)